MSAALRGFPDAPKQEAPIKNVLIVDDDDTFGSALADGLTTVNPHLNSFKAQNGKQAVAIMNNIAIDLVITDLRMPSMGGVELTLWINELWPRVPVVVLSAYADTDTVLNLSTQGNYFFDKPLDFASLARTVNVLTA
ncbi:MAG TPA: response regulator [Nitrospirota bacterium]|nr:response regulator [Nitrospirota bacterium]